MFCYAHNVCVEIGCSWMDWNWFRIQSVALCMASSMWATWVISILYAGWAEARVQQWAQPPSWGAQWSGVVPDSSLPCPQPGTGKMYTTQVCIVYMYRHIGCTVKWVPYCSMSIAILMGEMRERLNEASSDSFFMYHALGLKWYLQVVLLTLHIIRCWPIGEICVLSMCLWS